MSPFAFRELAQFERSDGHADQAKHFDAEPFEHSTDLSILPLVEHDREPCSRPRSGPQQLDALHSRPRALPYSSTLGRSNLHVIRLFHVRCRIEQSIGPARVVREQEESFARLVQSADRADERKVCIQAVVDGVSSFRIIARRHEAARLVERDVDLLRLRHGNAVDFDAVTFGHDPDRPLANDLAVDADSARTNQSFPFGTRAIPQL